MSTARRKDGTDRIAFDVDGTVLRELDQVTLLCDVEMPANNGGNGLEGVAHAGSLATVVLVNSRRDVCLEIFENEKSGLADAKACQVRLCPAIAEGTKHA